MKPTYMIISCLVLNLTLARFVVADDSINRGLIHAADIQQSDRASYSEKCGVETAGRGVTKKRFRVVRCYGLVPVNKYFDAMESQCKNIVSGTRGEKDDRAKALYPVSH